MNARETTVTVDNLKVRELGGQLIIQWAEPDGAFQPPISLGKNQWGDEIWQSIRCRLFIGNNWFLTDNPGEKDVEFLWVDVPAHSGTAVIPAMQWQDIKTRMQALGLSSVGVGGMYRENFHEYDYTLNYEIGISYHNRGYFDFSLGSVGKKTPENRHNFNLVLIKSIT